jgi:prepilin-type N-terminal cleavage/methylation domain-containing protein
MTKISNLTKNLNSHKGFTLIELILYISILTIILSALVPFAWNSIGTGVKSSVQQEVNSNARYASERIKYEIRKASGISSVLPNSIHLTNFSPDTFTLIYLSDGNIMINKNGSSVANLNSTNTVINSLTFTNYTSPDTKTKHIQFVINIAAKYGASRQE